MKAVMVLVLLAALPLSHAQQQDSQVADLSARDRSMREIDTTPGIPAHNLKGLTILQELIPQYPTRASTRGIEGYAKVSFTVTEEGSTRDIVIVESRPQGIFDSASIRTIERFRFSPPMEAGRAVAIQNVEYVFTYELP